MARNNENGPSRVERALKTFADSLIARMEDASRDLTWNKGWTEGMSRYVGLPQNIKGQTYMGGQALFLQLHTSREGFSMPVYMTMKMADEYGAKINKGAKSTDVFKFGVRAYGEDGKRIPEAEYFRLSDEEKKKCKTSTYLRTFVEWNIDQTNFKEVQPDLYAKLEKKFQVGKLDQTQDTEGMYRNEALDKLIHEDGAWICTIKEASGSAAFYRPSVNEIQIPTKENFNIHPGNVQETFKDGQEYYSTALHEMAHSTGHESQLSREGITGSHKFGDAAYAKEELVAELTAAMVCNAMGFDKRITENSAAYLKDWASEMRKNPRYIVSVMADVNKASRMEIERIDVQRKALGMRPLMDGSLDGEQERVKNEQQLSEVEKAAQEEKKEKDTKLLSDAGLKDQKTYFCPLTLVVDNLGLGKLWDDGKNEEVINALKSAQQESGRSWGMEEVSSLGYELPREVLGEDEGYVYALGEDGHFVMAEKVQRETVLLELGKAEVTQEEKDFIKDENNEPMKTEEVNAKSLDGRQQEVAVNKDGSEVFYASADTVTQEYSEDFDAYRENGNKAVMLNTARDWMRQFDVDVKQWQVLEPSEVEKLNIIAEDDKTAVAYYENSGSYDLLPKLSRQDILDDIKASGLDENASTVVKGIAYDDIARQFSELDSSSQIVFPNDEYLDFKYNRDTNKIELGHYMNAGMAVEHEFDYDTSLSLRDNMEVVTEELMKLPQYQKQEDVSEFEESTIEVDPRDEKKFYSSFAFMQTEEDTEQFEKLRQEGKYDEMLFLASEHVQDSDIDLTYVKEHAHEFQGDDLVAENEELAVVYNGSVGGTYDLLRKVSENDIREKIDREGGLETFHLPDYPKAVWDIQRDMTAEEWKDGRKDNLPMPSGDVLHASYNRENDTLEVRDPKKGDEILASVKYIHRESMEKNLGNAYVGVTMSHPEYEERQVKEEISYVETVDKRKVADNNQVLKVAHEDSNIETNVADDAKRIAATGVPMEKAEKIAKADADDMKHEEMHREEAEQALEKQKKLDMEQKEEEKKKQQEARRVEQDKKYDMYATHAAILLGGLAAAEKNDGVWMNKGFRQSPSFLFSQKLAIEPYNEVLMGLASEEGGFRTNVYTTFDDAKRNGIYVQAKQKSIPFSWVQWQYLNPNNEKDVLTPKQFEALDKKARQNYVLHASKRPINIFNVEQTTYPSVGKEAFTELLKLQGDQKESVDIGRTANVYRSYSEMTERHPGMVVLMREDDSFKCFKGVARKVAEALGAKPGVAEYKGEKVPYMEFPADRLEDYLPKLSAGNRVVICKKSEDPVIIKQLENPREILENAYTTARNFAKTDGMNYERVMVLQPASYDARTNTFSVSGMSQPDTNDRTAAMEKASDIYRKLAMVTGLENRLDRSGRNNLTPIDDVKYDRLVQELAAGVMMARQGLPAVISKENRELIPYWAREVKENPKMMGIIERDIDTTLEVIDNLKEGRKPDYSKILGNAAPKHKLNRADYTAVKELNRLADIEYKEFVVVKDPEKKAVSVILPAGASLEVDNEVPGMRKDRIATAIRKEGYEEVRFFNAGGSLGLKEPNEFFRGKEVSIVSLKGYDIEKQRDIDLSKHLEKNPVISLNAFRKPEGGWYFHIKAEGEKGFCVDPEKKYINSYFAAYKKGDKANFEAMKQELGRQFYKLAKVHEDVKRDYLMPRKVDVDYSRIRSAFISQSSKDPNTKMLTVNIDGERMFHQVSKEDYRKLWLAEDKVAYAKGLAAVAFEDYLKNGNKQQTELGFKEGQGQGQDVSQNEAKGQSEDDGADRGHSPEPKPASEVDKRHKVGFHI